MRRKVKKIVLKAQIYCAQGFRDNELFGMDKGTVFFLFKNHQLLSEIPRCQIMQVRQPSCIFYYKAWPVWQTTLCAKAYEARVPSMRDQGLEG